MSAIADTWPEIERIVAFLDEHELYLATAESCTAGLMASLMADVTGCGSVLDRGYVVYSPKAKNRCLGVSFDTIERFGLTSEEVAREMAIGALRVSDANITVANTGLAGPTEEEEKQGKPPEGLLCFAWALQRKDGQHSVLSETKRFPGQRNEVREAAARYGLQRLERVYRQLK